MKKTLTALFQVSVLGASIAAAGNVSAATDFNVVGSWSSLELFKKFEQPFWAEGLSSNTKGTLQASVTTFDQMGIPGADVYRYLSDGMFDVGMTVVDYTVQDAPELEALDLPLIAPDVATARKVSEAFLPIAEKTMNTRFDSHVLAIVPYPSQVVFCNTPISGLADLKGLKVRASGRSTSEFLEAIGAHSLNIAFNEVPGSLDRGLIDCAVTGSLSGYSAAWHEMATHLLPIPVGGWDYVMTAINNTKWNELSGDEQALLQSEINSQFVDKVWANAELDTEQGIACLTGSAECTKGPAASMTLVNASEADFAMAHKALDEHVLPVWAKRVDAATLQAWNEQVGSLVGLTAK